MTKDKLWNKIKQFSIGIKLSRLIGSFISFGQRIKLYFRAKNVPIDG